MHTSEEHLTEHETRFYANTPVNTHHFPSITLNTGFPLPSFSSQDRQWVGIQVERRSLSPGVLEVVNSANVAHFSARNVGNRRE